MESDRFAGKKVAVYARYSSQLQREASIDDQVRRCREFVVARGGIVTNDLIFTDAATSGASLARPGFEKMMKAVANRRLSIEAVVTEDVSRISRDFADAASVFQQLQYLGVPLLGVGDGVDTAAKHGKLTFGMKALIGDLYLDDLRDRTKRGLVGRNLAGYSTGGLPLGYRSVPVLDAYDRPIGYRIEIDSDSAEIVRRIFRLYTEGKSHDAIARLLNDEQVPPPRSKTRHRRKGWVASTVRAMLHNEAYIGRWTYNRNEWRKVPGTNARRPRPRDASEHMCSEHPERRIIDEELWSSVSTRLRAVREFYTKGPDGEPKGRAAPGKKTTYPFSGLLHCGPCGAPMVIAGGSSARYYRCSHAKNRGTCQNKLSLREDVARRKLLDALGERLSSPAAIAFLRQRIAAHLGEMSRTGNAELVDRRERVGRTKARVQALVNFISDGNDSPAVRATLRDLEAQVRADTSAISSLVASAEKPIELPTADAIMRRQIDLEAIVATDPTRAREELRRLFQGGQLLLRPQPDGTYLAESRLLPLVAFGATTNAPRAEPGGFGPRATAPSCAGWN